MADTQALRVVVYREGDCWVAQGLELDIGTQAKSLDDLLTQFELTVKAELKLSLDQHGEPFAGIDPAPQYYHEMWEGRPGGYKPVHMPSMPVDDGPVYKMALCA